MLSIPLVPPVLPPPKFLHRLAEARQPFQGKKISPTAPLALVAVSAARHARRIEAPHPPMRAAVFAVKEIQWLHEPAKIIWCLHDEGPLNPKRIDVNAATHHVEQNTKSKVVEMEHMKEHLPFKD